MKEFTHRPKIQLTNLLMNRIANNSHGQWHQLLRLHPSSLHHRHYWCLTDFVPRDYHLHTISIVVGRTPPYFWITKINQNGEKIETTKSTKTHCPSKTIMAAAPPQALISPLPLGPSLSIVSTLQLWRPERMPVFVES